MRIRNHKHGLNGKAHAATWISSIDAFLNQAAQESDILKTEGKFTTWQTVDKVRAT